MGSTTFCPSASRISRDPVRLVDQIPTRAAPASDVENVPTTWWWRPRATTGRARRARRAPRPSSEPDAARAVRAMSSDHRHRDRADVDPALRTSWRRHRREQREEPQGDPVLVDEPAPGEDPGEREHDPDRNVGERRGRLDLHRRRECDREHERPDEHLTHPAAQQLEQRRAGSRRRGARTGGGSPAYRGGA